MKEKISIEIKQLLIAGIRAVRGSWERSDQKARTAAQQAQAEVAHLHCLELEKAQYQLFAEVVLEALRENGHRIGLEPPRGIENLLAPPGHGVSMTSQGIPIFKYLARRSCDAGIRNGAWHAEYSDTCASDIGAGLLEPLNSFSIRHGFGPVRIWVQDWTDHRVAISVKPG